MLIENMMELYVLMHRSHVYCDDGSYDSGWREGETFKAALVRDTSTEALMGESAGTVEAYTVTVSRAVHLPYHAVIKRVSDGKIFRITSDNAGKKTPACTALDIAQSTAEAWRLT